MKCVIEELNYGNWVSVRSKASLDLFRLIASRHREYCIRTDLVSLIMPSTILASKPSHVIVTNFHTLLNVS